MGTVQPVAELVYTPRQDMWRNVNGAIESYEIYLSKDGNDWQNVAKGVFQNIRQTLVPQEIRLKQPCDARYMKWVVKGVLEKNFVCVGEIGIRTVL